MTYMALARKWRPRRFDELVGQEHVLKALTHALDTNRVHHAFLFTGTRGVGKTTIARILAKCLNCERGISARPCGECSTCREVDEGRYIDLIEVDAASQTKVEDTRELLDNVQYSPARGRYKVYLIDEVHMLSRNSFNALLKTLEEPPPHVKFLLATTDPQRVPVTVLSRCLQFNLKRLPISLISERMRFILDAERIAFEPKALRLVAQAADGSMRDGLSLLDQLISFGDGRVGESDARAMLGTIDRDHVTRLADLLAAADGPGLLKFARDLEQWAPDHGQVLSELASLLARVAWQQTIKGFESDELFDAELVARLAKLISAEDVQLYYQTAILGKRDLELAPTPAIGFEMTLLRMLAFRPQGPNVVSQAHGYAPGVMPTPGVVPTPGVAPSAALPLTVAGSNAPSEFKLSVASWPQLVEQLDISGMTRQLAANCVLLAHEGSLLRLAIDPRQQLLQTHAGEEKLAQALTRYFGKSMRVEFAAEEPLLETPAQSELRAAGVAFDEAKAIIDCDPTVRALKDRFGATVQPQSVRGRNVQEPALQEKSR